MGLYISERAVEAERRRRALVEDDPALDMLTAVFMQTAYRRASEIQNRNRFF